MGISDDVGSNLLGGDAADQLRAYVARIERIEKEIDEYNEDKKDVYAEVKAAGFDKKVFRKLIARRRKDRNTVEEEDAVLDLYETALASTTPMPKAKDPLED